MTTETIAVRKDALVIGAGIAGLQAALDLADMGKSVLLVERSASIGGAMIGLSKVFPTLDCASCITTPRMASSIHHPNIETWTYADVVSVEKTGNQFHARVIRKQRHIREQDCIGCKRCEEACPVFVPDEFEHGLGARKAISIPFTNAIPQYPVLDIDNCMACGACAKACPTQCIDFLQQPGERDVEAGTVIVATGFSLTPMGAKKHYGEGKFQNVISALAAERLLAPHGPFGRVLRPSDGKIPSSIAYVLCAGSRDKSIGVPYCSRVCCMYAIKQAMLLSGSLPIADITIYYMDIRAFGKGYEQFYQNAKAMGIMFVKAKVGRIREDAQHNPIVRIERQEDNCRPEEVTHDLVVLANGMLPGFDVSCLGITKALDGFTASPHEKSLPIGTSEAGIFSAGTATGPKDIVDTVVEASAAAMEAANYLRHGGAHGRS